MVARESFGDLIKTQIARQGPVCVMGQLLEKLDTKERTEVLEAMSNPAIPGAAIARALKVWGFDIGGASVYRHRRKECTCDAG